MTSAHVDSARNRLSRGSRVSRSRPTVIPRHNRRADRGLRDDRRSDSVESVADAGHGVLQLTDAAGRRLSDGVNAVVHLAAAVVDLGLNKLLTQQGLVDFAFVLSFKNGDALTVGGRLVRERRDVAENLVAQRLVVTQSLLVDLDHFCVAVTLGFQFGNLRVSFS